MPGCDAVILHLADDAPTAALAARALEERGVSLAAGNGVLQPGDSVRDAVQRSLVECSHVILVLSHTFLSAPWPAPDLDGLLHEELDGTRRVIAIYHGVESDAVQARFGNVAGCLAVNDYWGMEMVAADIAAALSVAPAAAEPPPADDAVLEPEDEAAGAERLRDFTRRGQAGQAADVDFLMTQLENDGGVKTRKLVDYALGLIETRAGFAEIRRYLFEGSERQRNYAALYFKRRGQVRLLRRAVKAGLIDTEQAFSR